jgi:membrane protein
MKHRIIGYLSQCAWAKKLEKYLGNVRINKKGTSLYQVGHIFLQDFERNDIIERAGGVAFSFTLAVFPAIIFMITLIPYIQHYFPEFSEANIMEFFSDMMPPSIFEAASSTLEDILGHRRGGLLSLGAIMAFYLSTNGMMSLIKAFNRCYRTKDKRGYFKTFMIATFLTVILAMALFIAVILLIIGQAVLQKFLDRGYINQDYLYFALVSSRFIIIVVVFLISISLIFHFAPAMHDRWKFFSPGAFLSTLLSIMVSYSFSFYISNFGTYNKLYGSIGAMIAFMVWLFLVAVILLVGFELNASIDKANRINQERVHAEKLP